MTELRATRTLVLARHAKAEDEATSDQARELSGRGHADATAMGSWLVGAGHAFDAVVCSTATRTRQTWSDIEAAGGTADKVIFDDRVYNADVDLLLAVIAEVPERMASILVIGHAPSVPELADRLADPDDSDDTAMAALHAGFPSGCLAVLRTTAPWASLAAGSAVLSEVTTPRA